MKVYGLFGRSGTGKSHTAQLLAKKLGVKSIIDDGILIVDEVNVAGVSAKCETYLHAATKRAIYHWEEPRLEVASYIQKLKVEELIILGTSQKMITLILDKLGISHKVEWIAIESIRTDDELAAAACRRREGYHVIPIKPNHVVKTYRGWYEVEKLKYENSIIEIVVIKPFSSAQLLNKS